MGNSCYASTKHFLQNHYDTNASTSNNKSSQHTVGIYRTIISVWVRRSQKCHIDGRWVTLDHNVKGSCQLPRRRSKTYRSKSDCEEDRRDKSKMVVQCYVLRSQGTPLLLHKTKSSKKDIYFLYSILYRVAAWVLSESWRTDVTGTLLDSAYYRGWY